MQQGEQVQLSSSEGDSSGETDSSSTGTASQNYEAFLKSSELQKALSGKSGKALEVRLVDELSKGKNIIVELENSDQNKLSSVLLVLADKATSASSGKVLTITPTAGDVEKLLSAASELPISVKLADESVSTVDGALTASKDAQVIIASFEAAQSLDLKKEGINQVAFLGFSAGTKIPGSEDFENFLTAGEGVEFLFCSESIPLTLNAAVSRHIKTDDHIHVNLEKESEVQLSHEFYEVGHELLAKPEALATIIETEPNLRAIVFCNSPSDTDLIEVLLKKKGLKAKKLIGNVPDRAIHTTMDRVQEGEVNILILTDISGRGFPVEEFDVIVHYAAPEDPEIYLHRLGTPDGSSRLKRVISLVGSMDLGNFHFLKKVVEFDFQAQSLPSAEDIAKARFARFEQEATSFSTEDGELLEYAKLVEASDKRNEFILFLLNQALRKLPEAESAGSRGRGRKGRDRRDDGDDYGDDRGGSRRDRRDRDGRDRDGRGRDSRGRDRDDREERPKPKPTRKDTRFYVGRGLSTGLTEEKFVALVKETMGDEAPELKRSCMRDKYSFFDFEQAVSEEVFDAMRDTEYEGSSLVFQKAATLSVPLDEEEGEEEESKQEATAEATEEASEEATQESSEETPSEEAAE